MDDVTHSASLALASRTSDKCIHSASGPTYVVSIDVIIYCASWGAWIMMDEVIDSACGPLQVAIGLEFLSFSDRKVWFFPALLLIYSSF
jgi:hypothetical protein